MAITFPGEFRPGAPTVPTATPEWYLKFLSAESESTATLMGFYEQSRLELETFIRTGDLTMSDARFYRDLLDETNRIASTVNGQAATWVSSTIPEAYSAGRRLTSSVVVPERALQALSKDPLRLLTDTTDMMRRRVRQGIASGILEGLSGPELRARIVSTGLTNIPRWPSVEYRAGVIARTETMKAFNAGNLDSIDEAGARYVRWIASPDEATCSICLPRDQVVFRLIGDEPGPDDPYPAAQPYTGAPAHPRCRCTIVAVFRGPDGEVLPWNAGGGIEVPPKISDGDMGADKPPELPPATGDFAKAAGKLNSKPLRQDLDDFNTLKNVPDAFLTDVTRAKLAAVRGRIDADRAFWRGLPQLTDDQIRLIAKIKGGNAIDSYLQLRWGAGFTGTNWPENAKFYTIRALERIHGMNPSYLKDSPFLASIGKPPYRQRLGSNAIAAAWATGEIGVSMTKWTSYLNGKALRGGPGVNAGEEVILHEFMHALHSEFGLHATVRFFGPLKGQTQYAAIREAGMTPEAFKDRWTSIATRREVAPSTSKIEDYELMISNYRMSLDSIRADPREAYRAKVYEDLIEKYQLKIYEIQSATAGGGAAGGPDYFPTEYAQRGGYAEDFAESNMLYHLNPKLLKQWSPGRYEFIRSLIALGREYP